MARKQANQAKRGQKVLSNGAIYDLDLGRIVANPGGGSHAITSETASAMHEARRAKKRAIVREAANDAVERADLRAKYGEAAYIAALVQAAMIKATNIDDPKSIDAARFVMQESGEAESIREAEASAANPAGDVRAMLAALASIARDVRIASIANSASASDDDTQ